MAKRDAAKIAALPRAEPRPGAFWDAVRAKMDAIKANGAEPSVLANMYERARAEKKALEVRHADELRPLNVALRALWQMIPEAFEASQVEGLKTAGGHSMSTSPDIETSVVDQAALIEWVKANGYERKLTLYAPTVKTITMERLRDGVELPDGVEVRGTHKINFRKA